MMGFISYSLQYYQNVLLMLESSDVTDDRIYQARQLLKMLDDLADEGYTNLQEQLEVQFAGVTRLRKYLADYQAVPFGLVKQEDVSIDTLTYAHEEIEIEAFLRDAMTKAMDYPHHETHPFIDELHRYCEWIGYEEDTAYVFLLRDTLLPYMYYLSRGRRNIYPWPIGRMMLADLTGEEGVDDDIRLPIIEALEEAHVKTYQALFDFACRRIHRLLENRPEISACIKALTCMIAQKKIVVVESGCYGTFPMLLACCDDRVDFRMFTAVPYLTDVYSKKIFTKEYEKNRLFETLYSHNMLTQYAGCKNRRFYINACENTEIERRSMREIHQMICR